MTFDVVVEGILDEVVLRTLLAACDHEVVRVHGKRGRRSILQRLCAYVAAGERAAGRHHWLVLLDLDDDACAPSLIREHLSIGTGQPLPRFVRVAVREVEAWLLGDAKGFARFFGVPLQHLPPAPEELIDPRPKQFLLRLVHDRGRHRARKEALVRVRDGRFREGARYNDVMAGFVRTHWNIDRAAERCPSLDRCLRAIQELAPT